MLEQLLSFAALIGVFLIAFLFFEIWTKVYEDKKDKEKNKDFDFDEFNHDNFGI